MRSKRWLVLFVLCGLISRVAHAVIDPWVNRSSNAVNAVTLYAAPGVNPGDMLGIVHINKKSATPDVLTIYDSSGAASRSLGIIDLSTTLGDEYIFNYKVSSGITWTKSGSNADVQIFWNLNRAQGY